MSRRWKKVTLAPDALPLVVLWTEMLAATGIPEDRATQLLIEGSFPIKRLPYHGYAPRGHARHLGRNQIDPRAFTFSQLEVLRFLVLSENERYQQTILDWERPRCCYCPIHCPTHDSVQQREHPYAARFRTRWWNG